MINSSRQVDEIDGGSIDAILVKQVLAYDIPYSISALDLVYWDAMVAYFGGTTNISRIKIPVNTPIPFVLSPGTYAVTPKTNVITKILFALDGTNKTLVRYPMQVTESYSDTALTAFTGLNIYGNDNGSGLFNEDTYVDFG